MDGADVRRDVPVPQACQGRIDYEASCRRAPLRRMRIRPQPQAKSGPDRERGNAVLLRTAPSSGALHWSFVSRCPQSQHTRSVVFGRPSSSNVHCGGSCQSRCRRPPDIWTAISHSRAYFSPVPAAHDSGGGRIVAVRPLQRACGALRPAPPRPREQCPQTARRFRATQRKRAVNA